MMDRNALQYLSESFACEKTAKAISDATSETAVALPGDVSINDLEQFMPGRRRFRGRMQTGSISEFCKYANDEAFDGLGIQCFVDAESMSAESFFDLGDPVSPGHAEHRALLKLPKTSDYKELIGNVSGAQWGQKTLAEWIEDWSENIVLTSSSGEELPRSSAVAAVRRITIGAKAESTSEEQSFSARRSSMAEVEAKNQDTLPSFIAFKCTPFHGLPERTFMVRVSLLTGGESPKFSLRLVRLEQHEEEMAEQFQEILQQGLNEKVKTFVGTFKA